MVSSFFPSKKAQGLSTNTIIFIVLGMIVLVVLIVIFTGKTRIFGQQASSCEARGAGARCVASESDCSGATYRFGTDCGDRDENTPVCCVPVSGDTTAKTKKST